MQDMGLMVQMKDLGCSHRMLIQGMGEGCKSRMKLESAALG